MQEWIDHAFDQAKHEKLSPEGISSFITLLHSPPYVDSKKDAKREEKLQQSVHKMEDKQMKVTKKIQKLLQKAYKEHQFNLSLAHRECSEDVEEIPADSGNIYKNLEPTITLKYVLPS